MLQCNGAPGTTQAFNAPEPSIPMPPSERYTVIELWADSFHEGEWASAAIRKELGREGSTSLVLGFIPVTVIDLGSAKVRLIVYGGYSNWTVVPKKIADLIAWGKPDLIAYDRSNDQILFAVEETAAVPTGNQALQRCERMYGAARQKVPFWYLLSQFGVHLDGGTREVSIWPSLTAVKLAHSFGTPCVVLHYSAAHSPEDYSAGTGTSSLFAMLARIVVNHAGGRAPLVGIEASLAKQYAESLAFVRGHAHTQVSYLPPTGFDGDDKAASYLADRSTNPNLAKSPDFMIWPLTAALPSTVRNTQKATPLIKSDPLLGRVEALRAEGKAYTLSSKAGSRPQPEDDLANWIEKQRKFFDGAKAVLNTPADFAMRLADFPVSDGGNRHVTTAKNVFYLIDRWGELRCLLEAAYPRLVGALGGWSDDRACLLYVSNSVKPGRIFGDPFTGQMAAYATVFDKLAAKPRMVVMYVPHQSHGQVVNPAKKDNKGKNMMSELVDLLFFHGGVGLDIRGNRWI
jgi:hypothetical protein